MLEWRIQKLKRQLQESRFRLTHMYEEFADSLYDMVFIATKEVCRISTNGTCIYFDPDWLQKLGEVELDFILSHQLMHIALGHIDRPAYYYGDRYHLAADIVANGKLSEFGWKYEKLTGIGKIRCETFFPSVHGAFLSSVEAIKYIPTDPSVMDSNQRRQFMIDTDSCWNRKTDAGENGIIVLSPADKDPEDLEYEGPTFGGKRKPKKEIFIISGGDREGTEKSKKGNSSPSKDSKINKLRALNMLRQEQYNPRQGERSGQAERQWSQTKASELNWRSLLNCFVQEEVYDYSFMPPDRRMQGMDFFLPDYNVYRETIKDVLFMVDTSGSVTDEMLQIAYDEIRQAILQFHGLLNGTVAFFDTNVYNAFPFSSVVDIRRAKPHGGGGTDYHSIFHYIHNRPEKMPSSIVVITDGEGAFPDESEANNIPVLWLMIGEGKAPWGRSVKINSTRMR